MKLKIINYCIFILLLSFYSCGSKKTNPKKNPKKDTITIKNNVDTSKLNSNNNINNTNSEVPDDGLNIDPNASPENVVKTIIKAGKTGKYGMLMKLCNESIHMDGDAKDICNIALSKESEQKEFNDFFGNAKIVGQTRVKNGQAEVDIETIVQGGSKKGISKETIIVQVKYDKWYLKGL